MFDLLELVSGADTIAIAGHVRPDGDCVGSCLGLYNYITQVRHGKETWHIGIVHQEMISESVYLESIDGTELRMVVCGIFLQGCLHFVGQVQTLLGSVAVLVYGIEDFGCLAERSHCKEVGWYEEL